MRTVHAFMHHKDTRLNDCALTGFEYHRTDGQFGRSASLDDFDIRLLLEPQCAIARVGDFDRKRFIDAKLHIAIIDLLLIHHDGGRATSVTALACE